MTDLDREGSGDNFNFRGVPSFLQEARTMACLHSDGSANRYLLFW